MAFIETIAPENADDKVGAMYQQLQGNKDYLPNYASVYCYRPAVMDAWSQLQKTIRSAIDHRRYELVSFAAARAIGSSYCSLAYGTLLNKKYEKST